jgi:undecaprenyl-diphosphatase
VSIAGPLKGANDAWRLPRRAMTNLAQWVTALARPRRVRVAWVPRSSVIGLALGGALIALLSMFVLDTAASDWARRLPRWFIDVFEHITDFGRSGWFLIPFGIAILVLAAVQSSALPRMAQGVIAALAVRFAYLFLAIGIPGLLVTIGKRLIGRARPYAGPQDDPFAYIPFGWRPEFASMPSGHATTAVAAAVAIGAVWPRARVALWTYALIIMVSRVIVLAHHPSDVIAAAVVGGCGALMVRHWFAERRLVFDATGLHAMPGPSLRRIKRVAGRLIGQ